MKIHREGAMPIVVAVVLLTSAFVIAYFYTHNIFAQYAITLPFMVIFLLVLNFFRNPARQLTPVDGSLMSPADGTVVVIEETEEKEYLKTKCIQISIFMSIWNVHLNRVPISGKVSYTKYHPGKYLLAANPKSSEENERSSVVIKSNAGTEILIRQIAGAVARRIRPYLFKNQNVTQGQELGFIKFGSRVDIFLPLNAEVKVEIGDKVQGNRSLIAYLNE